MIRRIVIIGSLVWAVAAVGIGIATFGDVNPDARWVVGAAVGVAFVAALAASRLAATRRFGWAAVALVVSVVAPTYGAWAVNALPLVLAGLACVAMVHDRDRGRLEPRDDSLDAARS